MSAELRFHFGLRSKPGFNEFQQHAALVARLLNKPDITLRSVKLYSGSISENYLIEDRNHFDEILNNRLKELKDTKVALVTRFIVRRFMNNRLHDLTGTIERTNEGTICDFVTVGTQSTIMRPFGKINSWWSVGSQKYFEPWGLKRTWKDNRTTLLSEIELFADAAESSVVIGSGRTWPDNPHDVFFLSFVNRNCDIYQLLEFAEKIGSVEVEERGRCVYVYSSGAWTTNIETFCDWLHSKNLDIGCGI